MFLVEALYPFSAAIIKQQQAEQSSSTKHEKNQSHAQKEQIYSGQQLQSQEIEKTEKPENVHDEEVDLQKGQSEQQGKQQNQGQKEEQTSEILYLTFQKGEKILVLQSYENGWWYGHTIKDPDTKGFFPSNYIQTTAKPKPPPPPPASQSQQESQNLPQELQQQRGIDWVQNELKKITQGPVKSDYYLGIKGYKNVKIDEKNQNVLKVDNVRFDVSTGLAKVPVKDQAPLAKAVRQMGYYFDYHQWNQERNKTPGHKARPDPKKKKIKKLNLKGMK